MSLRIKLNLYFIIVLIVPIIVLSFVLLRNSQMNILDQVFNNLEVIANSQKGYIVELFHNKMEEARIIAGGVALGDKYSSVSSTDQQILDDVIKNALLNTENDETISYVNLAGITIASTDAKKVGMDFSQADFYSSAMSSDGIYFTQEDGNYETYFIAKILQNNKIIGYIFSSINGSYYEKNIRSRSVTAKSLEVLLGIKDQAGNPKYITSRLYEAEAKSGDQVALPMRAALDSQEKTFDSVADYRGVNVMAVSRYIEGAKLGLVVKIDSNEAKLPLQNVLITTIVVSLFSIFVTLLIAYFIAKTITVPINKITQFAKTITAGDFEHKLNFSDINTNDEIGVLSTAFDKMVGAVKESRANIEQKVKDQTKEISAKASDLEKQKEAMLNVLEDVEEQKAKAEQLAAIVRDADEPIISKNLDGIITSWNEGARKLYGYTAEEMIGQNIKKLAPPDKYSEDDKILDLIKKGERVAHLQTIRKKKNGSLVDVSISISPINDAAGKVIGASVIALDTTKEMKIDRAKTEFVSLASHQLRTPLAAINWYSEMLLAGDAGKLNKTQEQYLKEVYAGNQRMVDLVNALLNISRIDLGTFAVEPEPCDFCAIAKSVMAELQPMIAAKKMAVKTDCDADLPLINADIKLVRIIFQNLLTNALKYTPEKGKVTVFIAKKDKDILIRVADNGYGIPEEAKSKIFTKLFRADNIREHDTEGTGLGLYMVKAIVEESSGKVWFESEENKGTTFFVSLPLTGMKEKEGSKELTSVK